MNDAQEQDGQQSFKLDRTVSDWAAGRGADQGTPDKLGYADGLTDERVPESGMDPQSFVETPQRSKPKNKPRNDEDPLQNPE